MRYAICHTLMKGEIKWRAWFSRSMIATLFNLFHLNVYEESTDCSGWKTQVALDFNFIPTRLLHQIGMTMLCSEINLHCAMSFFCSSFKNFCKIKLTIYRQQSWKYISPEKKSKLLSIQIAFVNMCVSYILNLFV